MNLSFADNKNIVQLSQFYNDFGFVKVPEALTGISARKIIEAVSKQKEWNLVFNHNGTHRDLNNIEVENWCQQEKDNLLQIINQQASKGFQYFYETIPIYDIYYSNLMEGHFFNEIVEFLNSEKSLSFFRNLLSAPEITFMDAQITRYKAGHFLNCHNDDVADKNRVAAVVINLTQQWHANWGGALHLLDNELQIKQSFLPSFNEINIFKIPLNHYVGYVSPFATEHRISITGWLRSGINPMEL